MNKSPLAPDDFETLIIDNIYPIKRLGEALIESKNNEIAAIGSAVMMMGRVAMEVFYDYMERLKEQEKPAAE